MPWIKLITTQINQISFHKAISYTISINISNSSILQFKVEQALQVQKIRLKIILKKDIGKEPVLVAQLALQVNLMFLPDPIPQQLDPKQQGTLNDSNQILTNLRGQ